MMKHFLMMLLLPICLSGAVNRVFEYERDGTDQVNRLIMVMQGPAVSLKADSVLGLVSVQADTDEKAKEIEDMFRKLYKPRAPLATDRNVELMLYVIHAKSGSTEPNEIVLSLFPVVNQLKQVTNLTTFKLVETQIVRVRSGKAIESSGVLKWTETPESASPQYQFKSDVGVTNNGIKMDNLKFGIRVPFKVADSSYQFRELGVNSTFDMKPGQFVVVGKTNTSSNDGALILVLSAKLVD